nr:hypothetical protein [Tanacetum cinerariifolium]
MLRLIHRLISCSIAGKSQVPKKVICFREEARGVDIWRPVCCLAEHFGLLTKERLQGLNVIVRDLLVIDMAELVRMQICVELDDTWAWVPSGSERQ